MNFKLIEEWLLLLLLVEVCNSDTDGKRWVWSDARRRSDDKFYTGIATNDKRYTGEIGSTKPLFQPSSSFGNDFQASNERLTYEVNEGPYQKPVGSRPPIQPPQQYRPQRPDPDFTRPNELGAQTFNNRPGGLIDNDRPIRPIENEFRPIGNGFRPQNEFRPSGGYRPINGIGINGVGVNGGGYRPVNGPNGRPILTGPIPSWEQHDPYRYKDYDRCKCVHSFNCNSPGVKFGTCDIDKQYCCYKQKHDGGITSGIGGRPYDSFDRPRPVLAGPGGPIDSGRPFQNKLNNYRPYRPFSDIDRYSDNDRDLDEAYKRGLASAVYELYYRPNNNYHNYEKEHHGYRDYYTRDDRDYYYNRPYHRPNSKYGLYDPLTYDYYGRSANTTITAVTHQKS